MLYYDKPIIKGKYIKLWVIFEGKVIFKISITIVKLIDLFCQNLKAHYMKFPLFKAIMLLVGVWFTKSLTSCTVHHVHPVKVVKVKKLPPGQAKKISGEKSARRHAHGY